MNKALKQVGKEGGKGGYPELIMTVKGHGACLMNRKAISVAAGPWG